MTNELQKYQAETPAEVEIKNEVSALVREANTLKVNDDNDLSYATDVVKLIKEQNKHLDNERLKITSPLNAVLKHVNARFKTLSEPLEKAEVKIKLQLGAYLREKQAREFAEQQKLKREAEERAKAEAAKLLAQGKIEQAQEMKAHAQEIKQAEILPIKQNVAGEATGAKVHTTQRWVFELVDIKALAEAYPQFVLTDDKAINKAIAAGIREMPGLKIKQEMGVSVR